MTGVGISWLRLPHLSDAKVSKLYYAVGREEDVLALQITVQNLAVVHVLEREAQLHKPIQNLVLRQQLRRGEASLLLQASVQIAAVGKVHDDVEVGFVVEALLERDDVRVPGCGYVRGCGSGHEGTECMLCKIVPRTPP